MYAVLIMEKSPGGEEDIILEQTAQDKDVIKVSAQMGKALAKARTEYQGRDLYAALAWIIPAEPEPQPQKPRPNTQAQGKTTPQDPRRPAERKITTPPPAPAPKLEPEPQERPRGISKPKFAR